MAGQKQQVAPVKQLASEPGEYLQSSVVKGILCILVSALGFALMTLFVKLAGNVDPIEKAFYRNIVAAVVACIVLFRSGDKIAWPKVGGGLLLARSTSGTLGILLNFYSIDHLLLGDANILLKISPFVILILSAILFKERVTRFQGICMAIGFIGIAFVVKPTGQSFISLGALAGIFGAIAAGGAYTCVRGLAKKGVKGSFIVFFFSAFSVIALFPYMLFHFEMLELSQWIFVIGIGLGATIGQFGITYGYSYAPAKSVSVFEYTQVVFAALMGFVIFQEVPDIWSWVGYLLISGVGIAMILKDAR